MKRKSLFLFAFLFFLSFIACKNAPHQPAENVIALAKTDSSWTLLPFIKIDSVNPVNGPLNGKKKMFLTLQ